MENQYISLPEAQGILYPDRVRSFVDALRDTLQSWNSELSSAQMVLDPAARAMNFSRYWYYNANIKLRDDSGVKFSTVQNQRLFTIDESIILRFKLIDRKFKSKNYPTRTAMRWRLQYSLPGFPPCERLEFGYRLDLTGTVIQDAFIILRVGTTIVWLWQLWGPKLDTFPIQLDLTPLGQAQPVVFAYDNYEIVG